MKGWLVSVGCRERTGQKCVNSGNSFIVFKTRRQERVVGRGTRGRNASDSPEKFDFSPAPGALISD